MAVTKTYSCDLCGDQLSTQPGAESKKAVGIFWRPWPKGWITNPTSQSQSHLCPPCISSIQALPQMCGHGYECSGGPHCGSDHK